MVSPARSAAFDALFRIETQGAFSSVVLPALEANLPPNDRSLCHEITLGVLRRRIYLDWIIDELAKGRKLDAEVRIAIQIGLFQMIFLDRVPGHAAINESVELVSRARKKSAKGFVNALLRSFQRDPIVPRFKDDIDEMCLNTSHPRWQVERWIKQFGVEETRLLCEANNRTPALSFRLVGDFQQQRATLAELEASENLARSELVAGSFGAQRLGPKLTKLSESGRIYFQDEGSQLVARVVAAEGGSRILDVCAAPGGKTTVISSNDEAFVVAGDILDSRIGQLRKVCIAHGAENISVVQYDAEIALPFEADSFETVFVDAPCSGTGTIRHNPEIRYSLKPNDFLDLSDKQLRILESASELVKRGGSLVYSTCSLEPEENEGVCERFVRENPSFELTQPKMPSQFLTSDGFGRTLPQRDGVDGFFVAVFRRA